MIVEETSANIVKKKEKREWVTTLICRYDKISSITKKKREKKKC